jgi:hypothetical protein
VFLLCSRHLPHAPRAGGCFVFFCNVALAFMPAVLCVPPMTGDRALSSIILASRLRSLRSLCYGH